MDELIAVIFGILVFIGPIILRFLGSLFEEAGASTKTAPKQAGKRTEFAEQLRRYREQQRRQRVEPVEAEIVADVVPTRSLSDSSRNESHAFRSEKQQLADAIRTRDDQMDSHLHQVFDHSLGGLDAGMASHVQEDLLRTEGGGTSAEPSLAAGIAAMMQSKQDIRRAFILGEILQPPAMLDRRRLSP